MEYQFAPWRMQYIRQATSKDDGACCILCDYPSRNDDEPSLILCRGELNYVIMNRYPYNAGHLMVVPYRHCGFLEELSNQERDEHFRLVSFCVEKLRGVFHCDGFNVGMNLGRVAGAGIAQHIHTHIVPRWSGDTNFMPVIGETKVINEALAETYKILLPVLKIG